MIIGEHQVIFTGAPISAPASILLGDLDRLELAQLAGREVNTTDPGYYKWTQWIFTQLYKKGLAYMAEVPVNWCPALGTVLANEEVIDGRSERGNHPVIRRPMRQWMLRITEYAERLLADLDGLDWPEGIKEMQRNWIGKSEGAEVDFTIAGCDEKVTVYTTRPDTLFGATYMVLAPEHPLVTRITTDAQRTDVDRYREEAARKSDMDRTELNTEKTGVFTGAYAVNPVTGGEIPIWIADYVLISYGSGAIMAVPAHDERDFEFAAKFGLDVRHVVAPADGSEVGAGEAFVTQSDDVRIIGSGELDGLTPAEAKSRIVARLESEGRGEAAVNYRLRDWLLSRQRYWGCPIPIVHCPSCGMVPVPEDQLPVELPEIEDYRPKGKSPLEAATDWVEVDCPSCGAAARRDTDTMDTFVDSSWYFLRYLDPANEAPSWRGLYAWRAGRRRNLGPFDRQQKALLIASVHLELFLVLRNCARSSSSADARARRHAGTAHEGAVQEAGQPGDDPGRRRAEDEQVARQRGEPRPGGDGLRRRFDAAV